MLWEGQQTLNAKEKDRDNIFDMQSAKKHIDTLLRALLIQDSRLGNLAAHAARDWAKGRLQK